jgi:hypothetical protein
MAYSRVKFTFQGVTAFKPNRMKQAGNGGEEMLVKIFIRNEVFAIVEC